MLPIKITKVAEYKMWLKLTETYLFFLYDHSKMLVSQCSKNLVIFHTDHESPLSTKFCQKLFLIILLDTSACPWDSTNIYSSTSSDLPKLSSGKLCLFHFSPPLTFSSLLCPLSFMLSCSHKIDIYTYTHKTQLFF